jgi:hypothetical protein
MGPDEIERQGLSRVGRLFAHHWRFTLHSNDEAGVRLKITGSGGEMTVGIETVPIIATCDNKEEVGVSPRHLPDRPSTGYWIMTGVSHQVSHSET